MNTQNKLNKIIESGFTQLDIASKTSISQPTISRIASGVHVDIKASTASAISDLYERVVAA
ncbi:MAG: hypothetical protein COB23_03070 [Methylophaga sp.]|nr:MAG: hypothetical protein COB23_03070 [Methylophaga sp.]